MNPSTVSLAKALDETRTGDLWLFRGSSGPDRAIQTMSNSPVNHVGMTIAIEDLPPLIWHAELGDKLTDMWTGGNHRGVQLNDARQVVERWVHNYHQRCWFRELTPYANRDQEDRALKVVARMDGTPFPSTARLTGRWFRGRVNAADFTRGIPFLHSKVREATQRRKKEKLQVGLETAYCAETVAITYEEMGLLVDGEALQLVRPGRVLERRRAAVGAGLSARRRDRGRRRPGAELMSDWIALLATVGVVVSILVGRVFYLRRIRQGRADPVIDPSWPSTARPQLYPLAEPPPSTETSLYYDPDEQRGERDT